MFDTVDFNSLSENAIDSVEYINSWINFFKYPLSSKDMETLSSLEKLIRELDAYNNACRANEVTEYEWEVIKNSNYSFINRFKLNIMSKLYMINYRDEKFIEHVNEAFIACSRLYTWLIKYNYIINAAESKRIYKLSSEFTHIHETFLQQKLHR